MTSMVTIKTMNIAPSKTETALKIPKPTYPTPTMSELITTISSYIDNIPYITNVRTYSNNI